MLRNVTSIHTCTVRIRKGRCTYSLVIAKFISMAVWAETAQPV
jgi:hypothetical protein